MQKLTIVTLGTLMLALCGCNPSKTGGGRAPNPYAAPELDSPKVVSLQRRATVNGADNYKRTCIFLNGSFERMNHCAISIQTDLSITGVQAGDQEAEFFLRSDLDSSAAKIVPAASEAGDRIDFSAMSVGDYWLLRKSDSAVKYEIAFQILKIENSQVTVMYQVTSFTKLY